MFRLGDNLSSEVINIADATHLHADQTSPITFMQKAHSFIYLSVSANDLNLFHRLSKGLNEIGCVSGTFDNPKTIEL